MNVLVWGINYAPETTGIAPYNVMLCEHLRDAGHSPRMLTSCAYYPEWKKRPEDRGILYRTDTVGGVPVHRCWHYVPARVRAAKRILHEATFVCTSFLRGLTLPKPDVLVVVSPPLLLGAAGWLLGTLRQTPFVLHVQDLQPDAAIGLGMIKKGPFTRLLYRLEAFAYAKAARVCGISRGMLRAFAAKGVPEKKRVYFPNAVRTAADEKLPTRGRWRAKRGFGEEDFLAVYSGNVGVKQGLDVLLAAAEQVTNRRVRIVICGQGAAKEKLAAKVAAGKLANLTLLPLQAPEDYREMMVDTDLCVITQQTGTGQFFFPSKLLSALTFAKPVLAVADADSELVLAMREGSFGLSIAPGQARELAATLDHMADLNPVELGAMGSAGQKFTEQFALEKVMADFEAVLRQVACKGRANSPSSSPLLDGKL